MASMMGAAGAEGPIERFGIYVAVADLDRAQQFYERLFGKKPTLRNESIVTFDVMGGLYAAFAAQQLDRKLTRGDNSVPYLRVKDIDAEFARLQGMGVNVLDAAVVSEGPIKLFRFTDPDGNLLEFYSFTVR